MDATDLSWILIGVATTLDSFTAYAVKSRFNTLGKFQIFPLPDFFSYLLTFFKSFKTQLAVVAFVTSPILYFVALNNLDLSIAAPVSYGLHLLFIMGISYSLLQEELSMYLVAGAIFLFTGLLIFYTY